MSFSNAPPKTRPLSLREAIWRGDPDAVRRAGGTPLQAIVALLRDYRDNARLGATLRRFADTSGGARLVFGEGIDEGFILRLEPGGRVRRLTLFGDVETFLDDEAKLSAGP